MSRVLDVAKNHVSKAMDKACKHYGKQFKMPNVVIKESKSRGGYCKIHSFAGFFASAEIMLSSYYFRIRGAKAFKETCYHEVAHWIVFCLHGNKVKPHGAEWKRVMRVCFDLKPDRCFTLTIEERIRESSTRKMRKRKERTPAQIMADIERMAKVRAARG